MKRTPLKRHTPLQSAASTLQRSALAPVSSRQSTLNARYKYARDVFIGVHDKCEVCGADAVQVHHQKGRVGPLLLDERYWMAVCAACHRMIHDNPQWAYENGHMISRHEIESENNEGG